MDPTYRGFGTPVPTKNQYRRGISGKTILVVIGAIIAVIIGIVLLTSSGDKTGPLQSRLLARLDTMQKIVAEGTTNAKDPELQELNSAISIQVMSETATLQAEFKKNGGGKTDKNITKEEADTTTFESLKSAALNSRFDSTYRQVVAGKLDSTNALIKELYDKSKNEKVREALNNAYGHFKQLQTQLAAETSS
jgi:hypothetical protein